MYSGELLAQYTHIPDSTPLLFLSILLYNSSSFFFFFLLLISSLPSRPSLFLKTHLNGRLVDEMFRRADTDRRPLVKNHHLSWYVVSWYDGTRVDVDKLCIVFNQSNGSVRMFHGSMNWYEYFKVSVKRSVLLCSCEYYAGILQVLYLSCMSCFSVNTRRNITCFFSILSVLSLQRRSSRLKPYCWCGQDTTHEDDPALLLHPVSEVRVELGVV